MKIDIYDMSGKIEETRDIAVPTENALNRDLLSQYTLIYQSNQRQGTVQTKRKGQVRGGGKKPWKQKGTGHARAGSSRSPLWRGGGVTHGPLPRDHSMKLPQKMSRKLFAQLFGYYLTDNKVVGLHFQSDKKDSYSTKMMTQALKALPVSGKTLIVYGENTGIYESSRNIAHVQVRQAANVNGYDLLSAHCIVCEAGAISALIERIAS